MILFWLVVIDDFDVGWTSCGPSEAETKLIVDPNAVLSRPVALEPLQAVARRHAQVVESAGNFELPKFATRDDLYTRELPNMAAARQRLSVRIAERNDHLNSNAARDYVKRE